MRRHACSPHDVRASGDSATYTCGSEEKEKLLALRQLVVFCAGSEGGAPEVFLYREWPTVARRAARDTCGLPALPALARLAMTRRLPSSPVAAIDDAWPIVRHEFESQRKHVCVLALPLVRSAPSAALVDVPEVTSALDLLCRIEEAVRAELPALAVPEDADKFAALLARAMPFGTPVRALFTAPPMAAPVLARAPRIRVWVEETVHAQLYDSSVAAEQRDAWAVVAAVFVSSSEPAPVELTLRLRAESALVLDDCVIQADDTSVVACAPAGATVRVCRMRVDRLSVCAAPPLWFPWPAPGPAHPAPSCQPLHATLRLRRGAKGACHLMLRIVGPAGAAVEKLTVALRLPTSRVQSLALEASSGAFHATPRGVWWDVRELKAGTALLSGVAAVGADSDDGFFAGETSRAVVEFRLRRCAATQLKVLEARPAGQAPLVDVAERVVQSGAFVVWNENGRKVFVP